MLQVLSTVHNRACRPTAASTASAGYIAPVEHAGLQQERREQRQHLEREVAILNAALHRSHGAQVRLVLRPQPPQCDAAGHLCKFEQEGDCVD